MFIQNNLFHSFELLILNIKLTKLNKYLPSKFYKSDQRECLNETAYLYNFVNFKRSYIFIITMRVSEKIDCYQIKKPETKNCSLMKYCLTSL